jgi:UDP-N-acetylglucosamine 2-epimerase
MKRRITVLFGTRPEAIKMAPVVRELRARPDAFEVTVLSTGQHRDLLRQALAAFLIKADQDLDVMRPDASLSQMAANLLTALDPFFAGRREDLLLVQGDTTSAFAGALAAFLRHVRVGHVEAGLRTNDLRQPFPEEANRRLISVLADYHFAPSEAARQNLLREGAPPGSIFVTGNTAIDAVLWIAGLNREIETAELRDLDPSRPLVLATAHRRENLGAPILGICEGLRRLAAAKPDLQLVFASHPNPRARDQVRACLAGTASIRLTGPLPYPDFVTLMSRSRLIISDSGGVQEEAPALGVPVLVTRQVTERVEAVEAGTVRLVGADPDRICGEALRLLDDEAARRRMATGANPYGAGDAARRIVDALQERLSG